MAIDIKIITQLRKQTGVGIADIKEALNEAKGNSEKALEILRKKSLTKAIKKLAARTADEGIIDSYIHPHGKVGVLIEVSCETDFVAKNQDFRKLVHEIALQIAAMNPLYLKSADIPPAILKREKKIYQEQLKNEGKPKNLWDKIIQGKLNQYYKEVCLYNQPYIKEEKINIQDLIKENIAKLGEKIEVKRFCRFEI